MLGCQRFWDMQGFDGVYPTVENFEAVNLCGDGNYENWRCRHSQHSEPLGPSGAFADTEIDGISFSPGAVPETSSLLLSGIGGVLFAMYRRFAVRRKY